jgi:hypothetical protein
MRYYNANHLRVNFATEVEFQAARLANPTKPENNPWQITVCTDEQWAAIVADHRKRGMVI